MIHLGELKNREQALPEVRQLLSQVWPDFNQGLNTHFQATHEWPTLGQALDDRKQLFVMIIFDESEMASELYDEYYQPERFIKVKKVLQRFLIGSLTGTLNSASVSVNQISK